MQIEVLGERYQLQDPIGRGGMATIYRGRDLRMERTVAIKVLREVYSTDPKFVTRFQREAKAASSLQHPNIVQVYDYGQSDGNYFIVMEMVEGTDLRRYLRSRGILAVDRAIIIAHDVALGLGAAHRRSIVHRDVKPQNILVGRDGSIKLTDFGIASVYKDINAERLTTTGMTLGTVQYYAPEQAQGEIVNPAADVYALGIVMYEMLTGRTPFDGDTPVAVAMQHIQDAPVPPSQINPNIPPALENIILRCLEKIPEMRFRDGNVLARALESLGEDDGGATMLANIPSNSQTAPAVNNGQQYMQTALGGANMGVQGTPSSPNQANGATVYDPNGMSPLPPEYSPTMMNSAPSNPSYPGVDPAGATTAMSQQPQLPPYSNPAGNAEYPLSATRPFQKDSIGGQGRRAPHFAGIVTALILVATLVLLGFSIYLASLLNFIQLPGSHTTPTPTVQQVAVPDLTGKTYAQAQSIAQGQGFKLLLKSGPKNGTVVQQWPSSNATATKGSTIQVQLATVLVVPNDLVNQSITDAENELSEKGIPYNATPQVDPNDPEDPNLGSDIVTRTNPVGGTTLKSGQKVTLYVTNMNNATATPTQAPTQAPTQVPTQTPTPTPTPTQTPTPTPTQTATPPPVTTPTPPVSPTGTPGFPFNTGNNSGSTSTGSTGN
jgi:serine/threonine protein kinase/beta-lactam-binding protein with PASTA domain